MEARAGRSLKVGLVQRIVPSYRADFFSALGQALNGNLSLFAGAAMPQEHVHAAGEIAYVQRAEAKNIHLMRGKLYFCWQQGLMAWLREWNPDVLLIEANPRNLHSAQAILWMKQNNRPVVGWGLGTGGKVNHRTIAGRQWRRFLSRFDSVISYSQSGANEYHHAGVASNTIYVAPNAVMRRPHELPMRKTEFPPEGPIVLYVGRLQERKKIDDLIRACAQVNVKTKLQLWIVGDGPEEEALKQIAKACFPETKFFGALHGEKVAPLFQQADLFVLPGTGGLAIQEAMSYGLPVIVAEADGTQSNLVREGSGWVLAQGGEAELATTIGEATLSCDRLREMGKQSFDIVQNEVNLEKMVAVFMKTIDAVTERKEG